MKRTRTSPDFMNGIPELLILKLLSRRPTHGYELVQRIQQEASQVLQFGEGCIYPLLHRLEAGGHLTARREIGGARGRVVYRVTISGARRLAKTVGTWQQVAQAVNQVLRGEQDGNPAVA